MRWVLTPIGLVAGVGLFLGSCVFSAPRYDGPVSDHFDGKKFVNQEPITVSGFAFLRWRMNRELGHWPDWIDAEPGPAPPERVTGDDLRVTFVNHSTVLVQMDGLNVLTDPIWSHRCSPVPWAGPRRRRPPGIRFEDLPPIDLVLVSHNHYDHMDVPTLQRLQQEHTPRVLVGLGNTVYLESEGIERVEDMDWWDERDVAPGIRVTAVPVRHFSGRGLTDRAGTLWTGFVIEGPAGKVFFAGDTGWGIHFEQIRERFGPMRLAILPIGCFRPRWFMSRVHIDPEQAVRAAEVLEAETSLGVHFGTFSLGDDGEKEPVEELERAVKAVSNPGPRFWALDHGESRDVP